MPGVGKQVPDINVEDEDPEEDEEYREVEMLVDTALEIYAGPSRSTVERDMTVNSVKMPKSRAIHTIFNSGTTTRMSTDRLRRVVGQSATASATVSTSTIDAQPGCAASMLIGLSLIHI